MVTLEVVAISGVLFFVLLRKRRPALVAPIPGAAVWREGEFFFGVGARGRRERVSLYSRLNRSRVAGLV